VFGRNLRLMRRVQNSLTGQVSEAGPGSSFLVDDNRWASLTRVVRSGLDWPGLGPVFVKDCIVM